MDLLLPRLLLAERYHVLPRWHARMVVVARKMENQRQTSRIFSIAEPKEVETQLSCSSSQNEDLDQDAEPVRRHGHGSTRDSGNFGRPDAAIVLLCKKQYADFLKSVDFSKR